MFQSLGLSALNVLVGRYFSAQLHEEFAKYFVSSGRQQLPGPYSPKTSVCMGTSSVYTCTCVCVCVRAQRSYLPAMPILSFDSRKEYIHVLLLHRLEGIALVCQAVKDNELPLLKRREGCLKSYLSINICSEL